MFRSRTSPRTSFSKSTAAATKQPIRNNMSFASVKHVHGSSARRWMFLSMGLFALLVIQFLSSHSSSLFSGSSSECMVSFGDYKGHIYTTKETVGKPKCWLESKWMRIQQHKVQFPGQTSIIPDWLWIDYHDRINVLVEAPRSTGERQFYIFEQSKYALEGRISKAIIGGIIEPGERPEIAAQREVEEEMHLKCEEFHLLGRFRTDVNRGMGWVNSFLAAHCQPIVQHKSPDEGDTDNQVGAADVERQDLIKLSLTELREAVQKAEFVEVQWSNTVALALVHPELASSK
jgi:ADP-ribose pyrophosphatase YjhB (NUDIX family)